MCGLALAAVATLVAVGCGSPPDGGGPEPSVRPPNIIVILVDALRRDHVGLYGHEKPTTPFLDELGGRSVVFDDALSQAPETLNSTAILFTSRSFPYLLRGVEHDPIPGVAPEQRDQWARTPRLAAANLTLAEVLQRAGYQTTALFNNPHHHATSGFDQGFEDTRLLERDPGQAYARVDTVVSAFFSWLSARDTTRPFFAYLHFMEPHNPYRPPTRYHEIFPPGEGRHLYANGPPPQGFTTADLETMKALYNGEIRFLDDGLLSLVSGLGDLGFGDTLIVITADHGEEFFDHGGLGHGKTVELEQLRIPLIIAGAAVESSAGTRIGSPVRNLDLAPTIVEMAGIEIPAEFEGRSLLPLIRGAEAVDSPSPVSFAWYGRLRSLTTTEWHCMRDLATDRMTLYNRITDPRGVTNVAEENPELVELCVRELDRLEAEGVVSQQRAKVLKAVETGGELPAESDGVLEQLKALGYVE